MKMFDEARPQINNMPAYGNPAIAVLPNLQMMPKSHGLTLVSAMLCNGGNSFSWYSNFADTASIPNLLTRYHNDPEEFLENFFDYTIPSKEKNKRILNETFKPFQQTKTLTQAKSSKSTFSLSDL